MKKFMSVLLKFSVLTALFAQLAFASDTPAGSSSAFAEPLYLSLCGVILLTFGMLKGRNSEKDS